MKMIMKVMRRQESKNLYRRKHRFTFITVFAHNLTIPLRQAEKTIVKIIQEKGKGFTIFHNMFRDIDVIIEWGASFDSDSESLDSVDPV